VLDHLTGTIGATAKLPPARGRSGSRPEDGDMGRPPASCGRIDCALLTLDVHNNLAALGDRHIEDAGENGTIAISIRSIQGCTSRLQRRGYAVVLSSSTVGNCRQEGK
jgi:hypothetical protein